MTNQQFVNRARPLRSTGLPPDTGSSLSGRALCIGGIMDTLAWEMIDGCWEPIEYAERVLEGAECECGEDRVDYLVWDDDCEIVTCATCGAEYVPGVAS